MPTPLTTAETEALEEQIIAAHDALADAIRRGFHAPSDHLGILRANLEALARRIKDATRKTWEAPTR